MRKNSVKNTRINGEVQRVLAEVIGAILGSLIPLRMISASTRCTSP